MAAFGFLGSNPGAITVQGSQLTVTPGQSISLVGGNITIQSGMLDDGTVQSAKLSAPGGQINLASVASPGEILAGTLAQAPNINGQSFGNLGAIQISEQSVIDVSGNGGGTVLIRGGQFLLDNSTISANVTGPGPVINGVESIGGGIDIQVSQNAVIQNGARHRDKRHRQCDSRRHIRRCAYQGRPNRNCRGSDFERYPFHWHRSPAWPQEVPEAKWKHRAWMRTPS